MMEFLGPSMLLRQEVSNGYGTDEDDTAIHCESGPLQICSPIMEISTWKPHIEHFIVGMKLDSLGIPAMFA